MLSLVGCAEPANSSKGLVKVEMTQEDYDKFTKGSEGDRLDYFYQVTIQCDPPITTCARTVMDMTKENDEKVEQLKKAQLNNYMELYAEQFASIENPTTDLLVYQPAELVVKEQ